MASDEASAMSVGNLAPSVSSESAQPLVQHVYWRYGWRRPGWGYGYGWRRPYGYGWRRPYGWRVYHPWGWGYRPYGWRRW